MKFTEIIDRLLKIFGGVSVRTFTDALREPLGNELKRAQIPALRFLLCISMSATGVVLLSIGMIHALLALELPSWAVYLGLGSIAVLGGFALVERRR